MQFQTPVLNCGCKNRNLNQFYHKINRIKMRLFLGILFLYSFGIVNAQNESFLRADSLFDQQKFTEALSEYEELYRTGYSSPAMLLKMAFIQDASGNYADALYYMDQYYLESADRTVIGKIEEVANENNLSGYYYDDMNYFLALLNKYNILFTVFLVALLIALSVYILEKIQHDQKPNAAFVIQIIVAVILFSLSNVRPPERGIIISEETLLRSGPSAGAEPIRIVDKGHKVKILDQSSVWVKILWDGEEAYLRKNRIRVI